MANKTMKLASVAASVFAALSMGANAATFTAPTSSAISVEGTNKTGGATLTLSTSVAISVETEASYADNDIVTFTLTNGTFASASTYILAASVADVHYAVGSTRLSGNDANVVSFRLASGNISSGAELYVVSGAFGSEEPIGYTVTSLASDAVVSLDYAVTSGFGQSIDSAASSAKLHFGAREFYGTHVDADDTISLESGRLDFRTGSTADLTASGTVDLAEVSVTNAGVTLDGNDKFDLQITGDMTGIASIKIGSQSFTINGNTATLSVDADDAVAGASDNLAVVFTVDGTTQLDERDYFLTSTLNLSDENDQVLESNTNFGTWSVNEANIVVSQMSLNASGFISWFKVVNESAVDAEITGTATVTTDGVSEEITDLSMGTAVANGITTISEASILSAIGKSDATSVVDVSLNINIAAPQEQVHVVAEKKASNGRVSTPVYYNGRTFKM